MCMPTCKKVYELFILYEYLRYSHLHFIVSRTESGIDEIPHLYICSSSSDPRNQCFAAASWGDWTTNVGSVLGLHPHRACGQHRLWWNVPCRTGMHSSSSVHDLTSINMDCSPVLLHSWDMELGSLVPIPSLVGREAQHGEVAERKVLAPGSSLAHCHSGHVLLPAWTSDISAVK